MSRLILLNLRFTAALIILLGTYEWLFVAPSIPQQYYVPGASRAATALTGQAATKFLALLTAIGWLVVSRLSDRNQRIVAMFAGPLFLFPQLVSGCIVYMEYPDRGVPGVALCLGFYLLLSLTLFIVRPRDKGYDDWEQDR